PPWLFRGPPPTELYTLSLHDALPISTERDLERALRDTTAGQADEAARRLLLNRTADVLKSDLLMSALQAGIVMNPWYERLLTARSEEHTSELQSRENLVCRLLLEKKK